MCSGNTWGSICSDFFDDNDARVACKQLGYSSQGFMISMNDFLKYVSLGSIAVGYIRDLVVPLHINDLNCTGNEAAIEDCPSNGLPKYNCDENHDAAISCNSNAILIIIMAIDYLMQK